MQQFETQRKTQVQKTQVQKTYVALRLRPTQSHEKFCQKVSNTQIRIRQPNSSTFQFDRVFDENESTQDIFHQMVQPMLDKSLCGFNALICAYGQTSSGKTYTMKGCAQSQGLIQYSAEYLFNQISQYKGSKISMQYLEIYQEQIYDLLSNDKDMKGQKNKTNCQQVDIETPEQLLIYYKQCEDRRHFGETTMNIESSRSHVILELIFSVPVHESKAIIRRESSVIFVDLAGSEGATKDVNTVRKQEGSKINKSLLSFCNVVNRIKENQVSGKDEYINYRDSLLTVCLKTSLEGNSQLGFLFTVNQNISNSAQSLTTIQFSKNAGAIKSEIKVNEVISENSGKFDKRIRELTEENYQLNEQVENQENIIQQLKEQISDQNNSLSKSKTEKSEFQRTIKQLSTSNNSLQIEVNIQKDYNNQLQDQMQTLQTKLDILEKQQERQNANQQKKNVEPINNKQQQEDIKVDSKKEMNSIVKEKQVKLFEDKSIFASYRESTQQSKNLQAYRTMLANQYEKSGKKSPTFFELNDPIFVYKEIKALALTNCQLRQKLVKALVENFNLQYQNHDYEMLLKQKIDDDEDYGSMQQFYENMEISQEEAKVQSKQVEPVQPVQPRKTQKEDTYNQILKQLDHIELECMGNTKYVEGWFEFMEVTFQQNELYFSFTDFMKRRTKLNLKTN